MTTHAMIDLETLDVLPTATVLTIGGVKFDPNSVKETLQPFYYRFDVDEQLNKGRTISESTMDWWATQAEDVREEALGDDNRTPVLEILKALNKWCVGIDELWCQGPLFDYAILQNLYAQLNQPCPWNYWQIRDSRTLFSLYKENETSKPDAHNALADCDYQAKKVQRYYRTLNLKSF